MASLTRYVGPKDNKEKIWLVLWEAGVVVEIPTGVAIIYPSALILHFNVVITPNGERPTRENSTPLNSGVSGSRCSMVWFTQATVLQSAELKYATVAKTKKMEKAAQLKAPREQPYYPMTFDAAAALAKDYFPTNFPVDSV